MADEDIYVKDGTVDIRKDPANKKKTGNWKACRFILGNECCERLAYYGMSTNLVNYLQQRFGQGNATAANNVTTWSGTCYITPLLGAFVADAYLGRYWTIASFSTIYVIGMTLLTLSAAAPGLKPSCDSGGCHPSTQQTAACFIALYLIALGTGGIKPCVSSFGADQFDENDEQEKKRKSSFFNWFYFSINIGALFASSLLVWIQMNVGWGWGFGVPAVAMMNTMFILQGNTMDQHIGPNFKIPSASLSLFDTLSVIFWAPVYDLIIVPYARKFTGHERGFTQLQRMGIGLVISTFSMIVAGILEVVRLNMVRRNNYYDVEFLPLSIFWQVPQYFLVGCAEVFVNIGQLEFFYSEAPDAMRSLCSALSLTTNALGNYLSTLLVTIVTKVTTRHGKLGWIPDNLNRGHLDYFYWLLAILSLLDFLVFIWVAKRYTYKKTTGSAC
ncbi:protein NRT1/ PTR FAMILY 8.1-like isoform X3 [Neltuma alba]|uniref:protein NRT1/ PTR FAMILY 8.1-like isoform X3 n=1 Tax=Neltuma alba TaxID=207710 RepID=UPI0010A5532E|nr:protein NRT1/ PTR FAMILY 8.1-like isoform X3 [Prosopis alba]